MDGLCIFLLNKFCVKRDQGVVNIEGRKTQELFSYLLINQDRPHPRESLAAMLWNDISITQAKCYLRKALWQLQTALDTHNERQNGNILLVEADWIQLNPDADYWLDITAFDQAFTLVEGIPGRDMQPSSMQTLRRAVELYRGDLLEGCYHEWCLYERERFQQMYLIMLDKLMDYCEAHEAYETGLSDGLQILRYDQARERTHRHLMRLQYLNGNRTGALRQYDRCVAILEKELGVQPASSTVTLYEQIRDDHLDIQALAPNGNQAAPVSSDVPLVEIIEQIKQLQMELTCIQNQIQHKIATVETILLDQRPSINGSPPV